MNADTDNLRPFGGTCTPSGEQRTYEGATALRMLEGDEGAQVVWCRQLRCDRRRKNEKSLDIALWSAIVLVELFKDHYP